MPDTATRAPLTDPLPRTRFATTPQARVRAASRFAVWVALFVIVLHLAGFGPSAFDVTQRNAPASPLVLAHTIVASAWLLLFLLQTLLVATRRTAIHRRLGVVGLFLTMVMVALIVPTVTQEAARGYDFSGDLLRGALAPGTSLPTDEWKHAATVGIFAPLLGAFNFSALVAAGLWYRRRQPVHSRLMLLSLLSLGLVPLLHLGGHVIGHWPSLFGIVTTATPILGNALLFMVAIRDWFVDRRIHPISLWVPIAVAIEFPFVAAVVAPTSTWQRIATWLVSLTA